LKKAYESPSIEKIVFNYRDQIVVASAGSQNNDVLGDNNPSGGEQFVQWVAPGLSIPGCTSDFACSSVFNSIGA